MVERLLMDPSLSYVEIASLVRAQFAPSTERSNKER
jgi:hypothetical protein